MDLERNAAREASVMEHPLQQTRTTTTATTADVEEIEGESGTALKQLVPPVNSSSQAAERSGASSCESGQSGRARAGAARARTAQNNEANAQDDLGDGDCDGDEATDDAEENKGLDIDEETEVRRALLKPRQGDGASARRLEEYLFEGANIVERSTRFTTKARSDPTRSSAASNNVEARRAESERVTQEDQQRHHLNPEDAEAYLFGGASTETGSDLEKPKTMPAIMYNTWRRARFQVQRSFKLDKKDSRPPILPDFGQAGPDFAGQAATARGDHSDDDGDADDDGYIIGPDTAYPIERTHTGTNPGDWDSEEAGLRASEYPTDDGATAARAARQGEVLDGVLIVRVDSQDRARTRKRRSWNRRFIK